MYAFHQDNLLLSKLGSFAEEAHVWWRHVSDNYEYIKHEPDKEITVEGPTSRKNPRYKYYNEESMRKNQVQCYGNQLREYG